MTKKEARPPTLVDVVMDRCWCAGKHAWTMGIGADSLWGDNAGIFSYKHFMASDNSFLHDFIKISCTVKLDSFSNTLTITTICVPRDLTCVIILIFFVAHSSALMTQLGVPNWGYRGGLHFKSVVSMTSHSW